MKFGPLRGILLSINSGKPKSCSITIGLVISSAIEKLLNMGILLGKGSLNFIKISLTTGISLYAMLIPVNIWLLPKFKIKSLKKEELSISLINLWELIFNSSFEISLTTTLNSLLDDEISLIIKILSEVLNIFFLKY